MVQEAEMSRRLVLAGMAGLAAGMGSAAVARGGSMTRFAYVGCRTSRERNAKGDGIGVYRIGGDGGWTRIQLVGDLLNPSWLSFDRTRRTVFALHGDGTEVSAFRIDPATGQLAFLDRVTTGGRNPVHAMADPSNRFLVIANHVVAGEVKSGLASLPIGADGALGAPVDVVPFAGKIGPHRIEQPFPKPHQAEFDPSGRFIVVPDKGCDRVLVYALDADGTLRMVSETAAREGSGPRHVAFHPKAAFAYIVNELDSTIIAYRFDRQEGTIHPVQIVSALADDFTGNSRGSEIAVSPDGRWLYASNRGADTVATFAIDAASGRLTYRGSVASGGKTPRFFALSDEGAALFVANEEGHNIVRFAIDPRSGLPAHPVTVAETGSPTSILFI
jgi:6-phosphogluconolactonase (cycloisomerase 2 family)